MHACVLSLQVNAAFPYDSRGHGAPSLTLLNVLSLNIHPELDVLWEKEIPPLVALLEGEPDTWPLAPAWSLERMRCSH